MKTVSNRGGNSNPALIFGPYSPDPAASTPGNPGNMGQTSQRSFKTPGSCDQPGTGSCTDCPSHACGNAN